MNTPFQATPKQKKTYTNDSILEAMRHMGSGVGGAVAHDVLEKGVSDAWSSLLGQPLKSSGELRENQAITLGNERQPMAPSPIRMTEAPRQSLAELDSARVRQQLESVRQELKALSESIKSFHQEIEKTIDQMPVKPGIYHVNFLERLRSILKILKEHIDDSRSWLSLSTGRKQKKQYWGLYKKHGTRFGLSSERTTATQAG